MIQIGIENRTRIGIDNGIAIKIMINYRNRLICKMKGFILSTRAESRAETGAADSVQVRSRRAISRLDCGLMRREACTTPFAGPPPSGEITKISSQINDGASAPTAGATESTQVDDEIAPISTLHCIDIDYESRDGKRDGQVRPANVTSFDVTTSYKLVCRVTLQETVTLRSRYALTMRASEARVPSTRAWLARLRARETDIKVKGTRPFHSDRNKLL
ncbi:hypothetical protein EVAR_74537_1 [Eumeta japonica]|uniref:Uncharacterized protein n=1 Tax=Eumeta variegata TaxID=151549 RepID=A0A4C1TES4_EUMVA|nr:hypothetical protein EVAR_74537_1 [Eumeta japonica]